MARNKSKASKSGPASSATGKGRDNTDEAHGFSPNPKTNLMMADIAMRGGSMLLRRSVERKLLGLRYPGSKASAILKGRSVSDTVTGAAMARLATRSIPGAIIVGGVLLAKTLYDRRKGEAAKAEGEAELDEMAESARKA